MAEPNGMGERRSESITMAWLMRSIIAVLFAALSAVTALWTGVLTSRLSNVETIVAGRSDRFATIEARLAVLESVDRAVDRNFSAMQNTIDGLVRDLREHDKSGRR